jgi:hypothetical protein
MGFFLFHQTDLHRTTGFYAGPALSGQKRDADHVPLEAQLGFPHVISHIV